MTFYNDLFSIYDLTNSMDVVVYLHFQKAFDKVPHHKLLYKLKQLGIDGQVYTPMDRELVGQQTTKSGDRRI